MLIKNITISINTSKEQIIADINTHTSHICIAMFSSKHTYDTGLWPRTLLKRE